MKYNHDGHPHPHPHHPHHDRHHARHPHAEGPDHRGSRHRHGRGGSRRNFEAGGLRLVLLVLLAEKPRHGYDAIREIATRSGGAYTPSPGLVYPTLAALQDLGFIEEVSSETGKRLFAITEAGLADLLENQNDADAAMARLQSMEAEQGWTEAGPVQRALRNLEAVLKQGLAGKPEKNTLLDVADIIDEAARKIERL